MTLNELVCPNCGLRCLTDNFYVTCAGCNTLFYASASRTCNPPPPNVQIIPTPYWEPNLNPWIATSTVITTGPQPEGYQIWN